MMMRPEVFRKVLLVLLVVLLSIGFVDTESIAQSSTAGGGSSSERLVPAAMGIRTDKQGNTWNIEQNGTLGRVGTSMVNSGLNLLINGNQFYTYQPLMTADGGEYVLHNRQSTGLAGLLVARRIRVMEAEGVVRYLEVLSNTTTNSISLNVTLRTQFSGNYKAYYTDQGRSNAVTLDPREGGVLVTPGSSQANRAVVFSLCSAKATLKPSISSQNRYGLSFQYNVQLAAGQTVCLAHAISQVPVPQGFDRKTLRRAFRSVEADRIGASIPTELRAATQNFQRPAGLGGVDVLSVPGASALGVERGRRDVLALGDETRLIGSAACDVLRMTSAFGDSEIGFDQVTAIEGGNRERRDGARIFLRDGQVFGGSLQAKDLGFVMAGGGKMQLDVARLDRLVRAESEGEGVWAPGTTALLETYGGDRLAIAGAAGEGSGVKFSGLTPWGVLNFSIEDILWLAPQEDEPVGHYVEFRDGTRCFVFLAGDEVMLNSPVFGAFSLPVTQIRALLSSAGHRRNLEQMKGEKERSGLTAGVAVGGGASPRLTDATVSLKPYVSVTGKQRIVSEVQNAQLHVLTRAEPIAVAPGDIRRMTRLSDGVSGDRVAPGRGAQFRIQLWSGGLVSGHLAENFLDLGVRGQGWRVPVADIVELVTPVPQLSDAQRKNIARLLRQLGAADWQQRESASEELFSFGYLARSIFEQELRSSQDAEVRRRLEQILARLDG
jgi:hypothetical protein